MRNNSHAILLYGRAQFLHRQQLSTLQDNLHRAFPDRILRLAYEDLSGPALPDVLLELAQEGITHAAILPCGLPSDLSLTRWLPGAMKAFLQDHGLDIEIAICPSLEQFLDLTGPAIRALAAADAKLVEAAAPSLGKPGWSDVPDHNLQVFFCLGARCAHRGAHALFQHLRRAMREKRALASGPRRVMCARSSCLFPCNQGPLMVVHPEGVWYGALTPQRLDQIVARHFLNGQPVVDAIIHQQPGPAAQYD